VDATGNNYGLLFLAVDPKDVHYDLCTGISMYVQPVEPPHYDAAINAATPTFE
jgi:hypothetical protein